MKRSSLLFGVALAILCIIPHRVYAAPAVTGDIQEKTTTIATSSTEETTGTPPSKSIEYALPYPGILADNPLYVLKQLRDSIMEWLIADPVRKIEFYILQGDKHLNAGIFLNLKGKTALMNDALARSSAYSTKAVTTAVTMKGQGTEVPDYIIEHMGTSLSKHEEMLAELGKTAKSKGVTAIADALQVVKKLEIDVEKMK